MRQIIDPQMKFGEVDISQIDFDIRSRDELPKLLIGLQHIYTTPEIRNKVFAILDRLIPDDVDKTNGRPGMTMWEILVLGAVRLICNWDYDKLHEIANHHDQLRQMLGISNFNQTQQFKLQTLRDNISLFTPEILDEINNCVVESGHALVKKNEIPLELHGQCDSFVVETDVHYPTDINLLLDAIRKTIEGTAQLCAEYFIPGWRQVKKLARKTRQLYRKAQRLRERLRRRAAKKELVEVEMKKAHVVYLEHCRTLLERAANELPNIPAKTERDVQKIAEISRYIAHGRRQIDQVQRRVLHGETIPHEEKVFSIFEEHTEWISKGKAGVPQELGLRVGVLRDQFGFILTHRVMKKETDDQVAVPMVQAACASYPNLTSCSFDKGFHSPENQEQLAKLLPRVVLPRKGKLTISEKETAGQEWYQEARRRHPQVESAINALENHGLDRCLDHGLTGFKRYVGLAVLARNLQIVGNIIQQRKLQALQGAEERQRNVAA
jgi:hypothetical protein